MNSATHRDSSRLIKDPRCSWEAMSEPLAGTAPRAAGWILFESHDPWPRNAVESLVPAHIQKWAADMKYSILLIRQQQREKNDDFRYWAGHPDGTFVQGSRPTLDTTPDFSVAQSADPVVVVCTNGKRDQCCAIDGIALVKDVRTTLSPDLRNQVWEGTHIGGHRFAPTALYFPGNLVLGRLNTAAVVQLLEGGTISKSFVRGRSHLSPCMQVLQTHVTYFDRITWVSPSEACGEGEHVHHGRLNSVGAESRDLEFVLKPATVSARRESCGGIPVSGKSWTLEG
jgi:hypothetical protein